MAALPSQRSSKWGSSHRIGSEADMGELGQLIESLKKEPNSRRYPGLGISPASTLFRASWFLISVFLLAIAGVSLFITLQPKGFTVWHLTIKSPSSSEGRVLRIHVSSSGGDRFELEESTTPEVKSGPLVFGQGSSMGTPAARGSSVREDETNVLQSVVGSSEELGRRRDDVSLTSSSAAAASADASARVSNASGDTSAREGLGEGSGAAGARGNGGREISAVGSQAPVDENTNQAAASATEGVPTVSVVGEGERVVGLGKTAGTTGTAQVAAAVESDAGAVKTDTNNAGEIKNATKDDGIHVFVSTDETDLRPIAVVINSTLANAREPWRVDFHLVVPEKNVRAMRKKLLPLFPSARINIVSISPSVASGVPAPNTSAAADPAAADGGAAAGEAAAGEAAGEVGGMEMGWWGKLSALITYKEGSGARKELVSVFNFLPFYLPQMAPQFGRIVYLDADVVVTGDIGELADVDMEGHPVAAVQDCMQTFKTYFDFDQLAEIQGRKDPTKPWMPSEPFAKTTCVFNRGVLLMDVQRWLQSNISSEIEWWMGEFSRAPNPLYKFGLSQPPFLLTIYDRYKKLDRIWNTRGLGRDRFGEKERDYLATIGLGRPPKRPFVSFWADAAKILHFNGKFKPWRGKREGREGEEVKAVCGEKRTDCATLWWQYLSPEAEAELRRKGKGKKSVETEEVQDS